MKQLKPKWWYLPRQLEDLGHPGWASASYKVKKGPGGRRKRQARARGRRKNMAAWDRSLAYGKFLFRRIEDYWQRQRDACGVPKHLLENR